MLDRDNNFYLISLNVLITCLLDNVRIEQILPVSILRNVWRTVWRICILMLGCKGLKERRGEIGEKKGYCLCHLVKGKLN